MRKFTILCFIFCVGISFQTYGAAILSQAQITEKVNDIIARDNMIVPGGPNIAHNTLIRQNQSNSFKNFIRHARDTLTLHARNQAITTLRNAINNPQLRNVFMQDLEDAAEFLKKRLLRSEIMNQNIPLTAPIIVPGAAINQNHINNINNLIVLINNGAGTASGMLVPTATIGALAAARPITWRILTCAHAIPQNRLGDDNPILMRVNLPIGMQVNITRMAVFKRPGRDATVHNGAAALPVNTLVFDTLNPVGGGLLNNNLRAFPRYEGQGDIAWCELPNNNMLHNDLTLHLNVPNAPGVGFPAIGPIGGGVGVHQVLTFNRGLAGANITYRIHFVNALADAANIVGLVNGTPKQQNFIIGFTNFIGGGQLTASTARNIATELYANPQFIDPTPAGHNEFMFFHDAPSYWGMSGGPIFNVDLAANTVDVFGVVKGSYPQYAGPLASRCRGTFIRNF